MNDVTSLQEYREDDERVRAYVRARMAGAVKAQGFTPLDAETLLQQPKPPSKARLFAVAACFAVVGALGVLGVGLLAMPNESIAPIGPTIPAVPTPMETSATPTLVGLPLEEWVKLDLPFDDAPESVNVVFGWDSYLVWNDSGQAWRYQPNWDRWTQVADLPAAGSYLGVYAVDGSSVYLLMGGEAETPPMILRHDLGDNVWNEFGLPVTEVSAQGHLDAGLDVIYLDPGLGDGRLYRYDGDGWAELPEVPGGVKTAALFTGSYHVVNSADVEYYLAPLTQDWEQVKPEPADAGERFRFCADHWVLDSNHDPVACVYQPGMAPTEIPAASSSTSMNLDGWVLWPEPNDYRIWILNSSTGEEYLAPRYGPKDEEYQRPDGTPGETAPESAIILGNHTVLQPEPDGLYIYRFR
jgi:hypothetical protein